MSDFKLVTRKRRKKSKYTHVADTKLLQRPDCSSEVDLDDLYKKIKLSCETLRDSQFFSDFKCILFKSGGDVKLSDQSVDQSDQSVDHSLDQSDESVDQSDESVDRLAYSIFPEVVCYGLGNFAECVIARHQLGLLLALREESIMNDTVIQMYDPKFWDAEKEMLERLNCNILPINEEGKRKVTKTTVFFMPHCSKSLCNNLLWANWSPWQLSKLVVIGNSFNNICNNLPDRVLQQACDYIRKILPYVEEHPLPENFQYSDIFNDTSLHIFPSERLQSLSNEFWTDCTEPLYDNEDLEYIPSQ